jgi:hypothetical protein
MQNPNKVKASDLDTKPILKALAKHQGEWACFWDNKLTWQPKDYDQYQIAPDDYPYKVIRAKLKKMHKQGLIGGCTCGCRGDFKITDKGLEVIGVDRVKKYTGY